MDNLRVILPTWAAAAVAVLRGVYALALLLAVPGSAQGPGLAMLDHIEPGHWELRLRDGGNSVESMCITNGRRMIQLRHPNIACESYVVSDGANDVTVQYTCRGRGYGRTHVRRESRRLLQIESQGIADGFPFDFAAEARRIGDCQP